MVPSSILKCKVQAARKDTGTHSFPSFTLSSKTACHASQRKQKNMSRSPWNVLARKIAEQKNTTSLFTKDLFWQEKGRRKVPNSIQKKFIAKIAVTHLILKHQSFYHYMFHKTW